MYDLIIIGGGPAAVAAGVYAARKQLTTLVLAKDFSGQSIVSPDIQNWIGTVSISGEALSKALRTHLEAYRGEYVTIREGSVATELSGCAPLFTVKTEDGSTYEGKTILIATGANRRKLMVPGADTFEHKGLTYCATCDGPLFAGMDVAVIGSGNAGFESAAQLAAYAKSVTILEIGNVFRADPGTVDKVLSLTNVVGLVNAKTLEVMGDSFVKGLRYEDTGTHEDHTLVVQGVFVEIGTVPNTYFAREVVERNEAGKIIVDPRRQRTSTLGVWAAGDCTDCLYAQNNIAVGDAVKALEDIFSYLRT